MRVKCKKACHCLSITLENREFFLISHFLSVCLPPFHPPSTLPTCHLNNVCVCVCARARMRAHMRACMRVCVLVTVMTRTVCTVGLRGTKLKTVTYPLTLPLRRVPDTNNKYSTKCVCVCVHACVRARAHVQARERKRGEGGGGAGKSRIAKKIENQGEN